MSKQGGSSATGDVVDGVGVVHAYGWEWSDVGGPRGRSGLPWFGIFLVVFGGLLLAERLWPALSGVGSLLFLAVGLAFLVSWLVNRGIVSLYLGGIITALAAPDLLATANIVKGDGVGTLCLGVAFLLIATVRAASRGGWGWQAALGAILFVIGASTVAVPGFGDLIWPILLLAFGVLLLLRARSGRR